MKSFSGSLFKVYNRQSWLPWSRPSARETVGKSTSSLIAGMLLLQTMFMGPISRTGPPYLSWKRRQNKEETQALQAAVWLLKKLAIIHCPGHHLKGDFPQGQRKHIHWWNHESHHPKPSGASLTTGAGQGTGNHPGAWSTRNPMIRRERRAMGSARKGIQTMRMVDVIPQKTDLTQISRLDIDYPDISINPPGGYQDERTAQTQVLYSKLGSLYLQHHWMLCLLCSDKPEKGDIPLIRHQRGADQENTGNWTLPRLHPLDSATSISLFLWTYSEWEAASLPEWRLPTLPQRSQYKR